MQILSDSDRIRVEGHLLLVSPVQDARVAEGYVCENLRKRQDHARRESHEDSGNSEAPETRELEDCVVEKRSDYCDAKEGNQREFVAQNALGRL